MSQTQKPNRDLSKNIGFTLLRYVGNTAVLLLYSMLLARGLGKSSYGIYAIIILVPQLLAKFTNFGFGTALVYFLARKELSFRAASKRLFQVWALFSLLGLCVGYIFLTLWGQQFFPGIAASMLIAGLAVFPLLLGQELLPYLLLGINDLNRFNIANLSLPISTFLSAVILFLILPPEPETAILAFLLGQLISLTFTFALIKRAKPLSITSETDSEVGWRRMFAYAWKTHLSNMIGFLNYRIDMFIVNLLASPAAAGTYFVAVQIGEKLWLLSHAVNTAVFPHLIGIYRDDKESHRTTIIIASLTFLTTALASLILVLSASWLISLLFGVQYAGSALALVLLQPGILASSVGRVLSNDFAARGKPEINFYVGLLTVLVNILANWVWIPIYGISGAAAATSLSYFLGLSLKLFLMQRISGKKFYRYLIPEKAAFQLLLSLVSEFRSKHSSPGI